MDLARALTHHAGLQFASLGHSRTGARRARGRGVHRDVLLAAEYRRRQIDLHPHQGVLPALRPAAGSPLATASATTEERIHDVAEVETRGAESSESSGLTQRVSTHVIHLSLLGIRKHFVRRGDLLEPLLVLGIRVDVRVQFPRQTPVRLLDLLCRSVPRYAEHRVIVRCHSHLLSLQNLADVLRDGVHRTHRPGVVHVGGSDDTQRRDRLIGPAVPSGDDRR